ncbi:hypothetical protein CRE_26744 [Caenorhabditis remanei]|uniref:SPIN90/Ldb17 leucine-rich domain-containing protein n=1 Tax=Caenorhabditis remanei TaxID=31234 RepID=E3MXT6_CAERE|nr:hypothetical protein CRE_26744 [Caenorhabditis remanei]
MYTLSFDPQKLIAECVDTIRAVTDAPLVNCDIALQSVLQILKPHLGSSETFTTLEKCSQNYQVDIATCHDRRVLEESAAALFDSFQEKQELSYTAEQDDETICTQLVAFCDIVKKTDRRIPLAVISANHWDWLNQLLIVLQTDQNDTVREHLLTTLQVLMEQCGEPVKRTLLDTQLAISLVPLTQKSNGIQIPALKILALMYSVEGDVDQVAVPLEQMDHLNTEYFRRLYHHINDYHKTDVPELCTNFGGLLGNQQDSAPFSLFEPMRDDPYSCSEFGIVLIQEMNRKCTVRRLKFLHHVIELGEAVLTKMFYENDLKVLAHVLARESINHDEKQVRRLCLASLRLLLSTETVKSDEDIEYALDNFDEA